MRNIRYVIVISVIFQLVAIWANGSFINRGFVLNKGQIKNQSQEKLNQILFKAEIGKCVIWLTQRGISYQFYEYSQDSCIWNLMDMELQGAYISINNCKMSDSSGYYENHFTGNNHYDKIYSYKKLLFKNIYPGIDWKLYFTEDVLKQEFIVKPHADKNLIKIDYKASGSLKVFENAIELTNRLGKFYEGELVCYEKKSKKKIQSKYVEASGYKTGYYDQKIVIVETIDYNKNDTLIIDPILNWRSFMGGNNDDDAHAIYSDGTHTYVAGHTLSVNFPTANPGSPAYYQGSFAGGIGDVFINKFSSNGNLIWSTYIGGASNDEAVSIVSNGTYIWLGGYSNSADFPLFNPGGTSFYQGSLSGSNDAFICKFNVNGELIWSTYVGGTNADNINQLFIQGNELLVAGTSASANFPTLDAGTYFQSYSGGNDAFIMKFNNNNELVWSSFFGGSLNDLGNSITANNNYIFLAGHTNSTNLPMANPNTGNFFQNALAGGYDGYIAQFSISGNLLWSSYIGGSGFDKINSICTENGNLWITGDGNSTDYPVLNSSGAFFQAINNGFTDVFISKFDINRVLLWSSYCGGSADDYASCIQTDGTNIWLSGYTNSSNLTTYNPGGGAYFQSNNAGFYDGMIMKLELNASASWLTYFGSNSNDYIHAIHSDGNKIRICGYSQSFNLPAANPGGGAYIQANNAGGLDAYIAAFKNCTNPALSISSNSPICVGDTLFLSSNNISNAAYQWLGPNSFSSTQQNPHINNVNINHAGNYTLIVNVPNGCSSAAFTPVVINSLPTITVNSNSPVCEGDTIYLSAGGGSNYSWSGPDNFTSTIQSPFIINSNTLNTGWYFISVSNGSCNNTDSLYIIVNNLPDVIVSSNSPLCVGETLNLNASGASTYIWSGPNNFAAYTQNPSLSNITLADSGIYVVYGTDINGCTDSSFISVTIEICNAINELSAFLINVYPNPNSGMLNIEINNDKILNDSLQILIFDYTGRKIYSADLFNKFSSLNLKSLSKGIYYLQISTSGETLYSNKIIIN